MTDGVQSQQAHGNLTLKASNTALQPLAAVDITREPLNIGATIWAYQLPKSRRVIHFRPDIPSPVYCEGCLPNAHGENIWV